MAKNMLSGFSSLKKQQLLLAEELLNLNFRIEAMLSLLVFIDITEYPRQKLHEYHSVIGDLQDQAIILTEQVISEITKEENDMGE